MGRAQLDGIELEYEEAGSGEPLLLIHGGFIADAMRPLMNEPALQAFRRIRYHRRGYGGSGRPVEMRPARMEEHVADAIGLLDHLGVDAAHVAGHSGGAAVGLELAAAHPPRVTSLALLEPPLLGVPSAPLLVGAVASLTTLYESGDAEGAVVGFLGLVGDRDWRATIERSVPGGVAQAIKDASTAYEMDLPALPEWGFGEDQAAAITCPVLSVIGTDSGPMFLEARAPLHRWFAGCQDADIVGASHLLQMEAAGAVAGAIAAFLASKT